MIFRRSLVRELTATAVGLFLVLLAILFTNLVLRLLARAAGGSVAPDGILALLGFNALFYFNILLSVALFLTVLLTLSRWYRDSEMIVWFTSGQSLIGLSEADPAVCSAVPARDRRAVAVPVAVGGAAQARVRAAARIARRHLAALRQACSASFRARTSSCSSKASIRFDNTVRNVFLHSVEDKQDVDHGRRPRQARGHAQRRPLHRARARPALPGHARVRADYRVVEFEKLGAPHRARRGPRAPDVDARPFRPPRCWRADGRVERAELFWRISVPISALVLTLLADPARLRQPAHRPLVQPLRGRVPVHALQQLPQHRAEPDRAGPARVAGPDLLLPHAIALLVVVLLFRHQLSVTGLFARARRDAVPAAA